MGGVGDDKGSVNGVGDGEGVVGVVGGWCRCENVMRVFLRNVK